MMNRKLNILQWIQPDSDIVGYLVVGEGGEEHLPVRDDNVLALKSCIFLFGDFA